MDAIIFGTVGILFILFYFLPAIVAGNSKHPQKDAITVLNLFLGWTLLGWIIALIWACAKKDTQQVVIQNNSQKSASAADEIIKLAELKDKGIITQEEFNKQKAQILNN